MKKFKVINKINSAHRKYYKTSEINRKKSITLGDSPLINNAIKITLRLKMLNYCMKYQQSYL